MKKNKQLYSECGQIVMLSGEPYCGQLCARRPAGSKAFGGCRPEAKKQSISQIVPVWKQRNAAGEKRPRRVSP